MDKVAYSFVKDNSNIVFRSKVQSFNLDHVTDKDIRSFYMQFSNYAAFDTGLLPLEGTGLLSIRKAGEYTQVVYQHAPGSYYVNWGETEGDKYAKKYLLAQPYRIVIIDFKNNNLLGARTFYSKLPATYPDLPLYHVNLPNINCKGYRGNAVGWICLYHKEDWSNLPFNERLALAIERCSGSEAYNDANMSETDGPRFYHQMYDGEKEVSYLWNPKLWEEKTISEGHSWTLDAGWIPVMVESIDSQDRHKTGGEQLTLKMAILGSYRAYYTDSIPVKPITALQRQGGLEAQSVMSYFVSAYNDSATSYAGLDTMSMSEKFRDSRTSVNNSANYEEEEPEPEEEPEEDLPF